MLMEKDMLIISQDSPPVTFLPSKMQEDDDEGKEERMLGIDRETFQKKMICTHPKKVSSGI